MNPFRFRFTWQPLIGLLAGFMLIGQDTASAEGPEDGLADWEERIERLERYYEAEIGELRKRIDRLEETADTKKAPPMPAQRTNLFNPQITVFGNFLGRADSRRVESEDGRAIDDRFNLREVEVDFRSAVDPWADGVVITTFESDVPGEYGTEIEEGYLVVKKMPVLDRSPWGLKLKAGRFRPEFGRFNKIHLHDLPQPIPPLASRTFLGEEGFIQNGVSGQFFLPVPWERSVFEVTLEMLNGGDLPVGDRNGGENPAYLGHIKWFTDLSPGHDIEVGGSAYLGKQDEQGLRDARLYGLDLTYKWKPVGGGEWRSFIVGGELFVADLDLAGPHGGRPWGCFLWSQFQFNRRAYLGVRYDRAEQLEADLRTRSAGAFLTYYTTEFLRFRAGYERTFGDEPTLQGRDTGFLEVNFVFGSHPVEPYWVNR